MVICSLEILGGSAGLAYDLSTVSPAFTLLLVDANA